MGGSLGFNKSKSRPVVSSKPGLFGKKEGRRAINEGIDFGRAGLFPGFEEGRNEVGLDLAEKLFNPQFGPDTASEKSLIDSIIAATQGNQATRGLNPSVEAIASAIAPQLIQLRQQDIGNLQQQQGLNTQSLADLINAMLAKGQLGQKNFFAGNKSSGLGVSAGFFKGK